MPNSKVYKKLLNENIRVDLCPYNKYDTIADSEDFDALFNTLSKHTDYLNKPLTITLNTNVANPNFEKIEDGHFKNYYFEYFTETLEKYYPSDNVFDMWKEGMKNKFIYPQFHGREHINFEIWLRLLRNGNSALLKAFREKVFGLSFITSNDIKIPYLASFIYNSQKDKLIIEESVKQGALIFEDIFKFRSKSIIAPLYTWSSELELTFKDAKIEYIQGSGRHKEYNFNNNKFFRKRHIMGSQNKFGQIYLHRNCTFEPTLLPHMNNVEECLKQIENAFFWNKPAVISMHRLNFIGGLNENNRKENLEKLDELIIKVKQRWENVEFMNSSELGDLIRKSKKNVL